MTDKLYNLSMPSRKYNGTLVEMIILQLTTVNEWWLMEWSSFLAYGVGLICHSASSGHLDRARHGASEAVHHEFSEYWSYSWWQLLHRNTNILSNRFAQKKRMVEKIILNVTMIYGWNGKISPCLALGWLFIQLAPAPPAGAFTPGVAARLRRSMTKSAERFWRADAASTACSASTAVASALKSAAEK